MLHPTLFPVHLNSIASPCAECCGDRQYDKACKIMFLFWVPIWMSPIQWLKIVSNELDDTYFWTCVYNTKNSILLAINWQDVLGREVTNWSYWETEMLFFSRRGHGRVWMEGRTLERGWLYGFWLAFECFSPNIERTLLSVWNKKEKQATKNQCLAFLFILHILSLSFL